MHVQQIWFRMICFVAFARVNETCSQTNAQCDNTIVPLWWVFCCSSFLWHYIPCVCGCDLCGCVGRFLTCAAISSSSSIPRSPEWSPSCFLNCGTIPRWMCCPFIYNPKNLITRRRPLPSKHHAMCRRGGRCLRSGAICARNSFSSVWMRDGVEQLGYWG